jgi:hypothetical protein
VKLPEVLGGLSFGQYESLIMLQRRVLPETALPPPRMRLMPCDRAVARSQGRWGGAVPGAPQARHAPPADEGGFQSEASPTSSSTRTWLPSYIIRQHVSEGEKSSTSNPVLESAALMLILDSLAPPSRNRAWLAGPFATECLLALCQSAELGELMPVYHRLFFLAKEHCASGEGRRQDMEEICLAGLKVYGPTPAPHAARSSINATLAECRHVERAVKVSHTMIPPDPSLVRVRSFPLTSSSRSPGHGADSRVSEALTL